MKTLNMILAFVGITANLIAMVYFIGKLSNASDHRESAYWDKLNAHVIETWGDGKEHPEHKCGYDPAWCNPTYCEFLLKRKGE